MGAVGTRAGGDGWRVALAEGVCGTVPALKACQRTGRAALPMEGTTGGGIERKWFVFQAAEVVKGSA
jgi:hypothetical protein